MFQLLSNGWQDEMRVMLQVGWPLESETVRLGKFGHLALPADKPAPGRLLFPTDWRVDRHDARKLPFGGQLQWQNKLPLLL